LSRLADLVAPVRLGRDFRWLLASSWVTNLVVEEVPDAKPMACDVLVKVAACGITHNELDYPIWSCRAGHQRTLIIPGAEVSGVVADRLEDVAGQADLVFDTIGGEVLARSPALLRPGGRRRHPRPDRPPALTQAPGYRRVKVRWVTPLGLLTASVRKRRSSPSSPSQSGSPRPSTMGTTTMCR
jgi:hypothetical protein